MLFRVEINEIYSSQFSHIIGHFGKYHNTLSLSPQILHKDCFYFLLGPLQVPRETGNNAYAKLRGTNKKYYGIFRSGLLRTAKPILDLVISSSESLSWELTYKTT